MLDPISETITRVTSEDGSAPTTEQSSGADEFRWLASYLNRIRVSGLTETATRVIESDARYIVCNGILGAGSPSAGDNSWPQTRVRRGIVLGSVQSGKTASMLAVTAGALDAGIDVVVILAGTRTALWRQTIQRTLSQLDGWNTGISTDANKRRVFVPQPAMLIDDSGRPSLTDLYHEHPNRVRRSICTGKPLVALVMKQTDHLIHFGNWLRDVLQKTIQRVGRPLHMVVIDDEADDGSILDSAVEWGLEPDSDRLKQIPRHIARLWSGAGPHHSTHDPALFATYVAYTATPQANFLQSDHNPLSPSDFAVALRTPMHSGLVGPTRSPTYCEPAGLSCFYTGGEVFYRRMGDPPGGLIVVSDFPARDDFSTDADHREAVDTVRRDQLFSALRGYFVAAACHLLLSDKRYSTVRQTIASTVEELRRMLPTPFSALVHPSCRQDEHTRFAEIISAWSCGFDPIAYDPDKLPRDSRGTVQLSAEGLAKRLAEEEDQWRSWLAYYEATRQRLASWPGGSGLQAITDTDWESVQTLLLQEVFPQARISIINSDPQADDRPRFNPQRMNDGRFRMPVDLLTIFVSGNVMSRGITIEGLATTVFFRASNQPAADTQMQMQRWFGFRGPILRWCRVFMFNDQYDLFRSYHEADEALRAELISEMNSRIDKAPNPLVLCERHFRATAKIANTRSLPLCPGADPFVRPIERGDYAQINTSILADCLSEGEWVDVVARDRKRGIIRADEQLSLTQAADILDRFRYAHHDPDPGLEQHTRWASLQAALECPSPLFRPPRHLDTPVDAVQPQYCPYTIAAYLRLWDAALTRKDRARGLYPTDDRTTPWNMINLVRYAEQVPYFYLGVRYGSQGLCTDLRLHAFGIERMIRSARNNILEATWGSRNPGDDAEAYLGDQLFDYHYHGRLAPRAVPGEPLWRPRGEPGLILFHVLRGEAGEADAVTVGLALPLGGPDHFATLRPVFAVQS